MISVAGHKGRGERFPVDLVCGSRPYCIPVRERSRAALRLECDKERTHFSRGWTGLWTGRGVAVECQRCYLSSAGTKVRHGTRVVPVRSKPRSAPHRASNNRTERTGQILRALYHSEYTLAKPYTTLLMNEQCAYLFISVLVVVFVSLIDSRKNVVVGSAV